MTRQGNPIQRLVPVTLHVALRHVTPNQLPQESAHRPLRCLPDPFLPSAIPASLSRSCGVIWVAGRAKRGSRVDERAAPSACPASVKRSPASQHLLLPAEPYGCPGRGRGAARLGGGEGEKGSEGMLEVVNAAAPQRHLGAKAPNPHLLVQSSLRPPTEGQLISCQVDSQSQEVYLLALVST